MSEFVKQSNNPGGNEWTNWLEEAIKKEHIKYYEYEHFNNIEKIGFGAFSNVYQANWKHTEKVFALKAFKNSIVAIKELINEVINYQYYFGQINLVQLNDF